MARNKLIRTPQKYVQGYHVLLNFYQETQELGNRYLFVCSKSGYNACYEQLEKSFDESTAYRHYEIFSGRSSNEEITRMCDLVREHQINIVTAVGGGSAIDTAKVAALFCHIPIVIIPTISATDAPCTGDAVVYHADGNFDRYEFLPQNPNAIIVDTDIIAHAPARFLVAGMGDALATYFETRICYHTDGPSVEGGGVSRAASTLSKLCYETLLQYGVQALHSCERQLVTPALEAIIEANTYLSGVGSDNGGLAVAHSVYNGFTILEDCTSMHGEVVAFGVITQLLLEGAPQEELHTVINFCYDVGLPVTLKDMGLTASSELMNACEKACADGETIHNMPGDITPQQLYDALLLADILGTEKKKGVL